MKLKKLLALMFVVAALFVCSITASAAVSGGNWGYDDDGNQVYYVDGEIVKNDWIKTEYEGTFYADETGALYANGVYEIGGNSYAFSEDAVLYAGYVFKLGEDYYYADQNGVIAKNQWIETENNWEYNFLAWYYAGPDGKLLKGMQDIGGKRYYFEDNPSYSGQCVMLEDVAFQLYDEVADEYYNYFAKEGGALARNEWGKTYEREDAYYGDDYLRIDRQTLLIDGKLYLFGNNGELIRNQVIDLHDEELDKWVYYHALADGTVVTNKWEQTYLEDGDEEWFYYGADGARYTNGVYKIGSNYYYFDGYGSMLDDSTYNPGDWNEELEEWVITASYRARSGGALYVNEWYQDEWGNWYYYGAEGKAAQGKAVVNGKTYLFDEYGYMLEDTVTSIFVDGVRKHYIAKGGKVYEAKNNQWTKVGEDYYYVQNDEFCRYDEIYTIGGKRYGFDYNGIMYDGELFEIWDDGMRNTYYAKTGGALAENEVIYIPGGNYSGYHLFGPGGAKPHEEGLYELGGKYYYLNGYWTHSTIITNQIKECGENGVYKFGANGEGTKLADGWYYIKMPVCYGEGCSEVEGYIYVRDGALLKDGVYTINSKRYVFNYEGILRTNGVYRDPETDKRYYMTPITEGGHISTEKNVWKKVNGEYIYLSADSSVHIGWLDDTYYMTPYMIYGSYFTDTNTRQVYIANEAGITKKITKTGFLNYAGQAMYLKNGKAVQSDWINHNGTWYYAGAEGVLLERGAYKIKDKYYCFDLDGKMLSNGWITPDNGSTWYKADASGALATGISGGYLFDYNGRLTSSEIISLDGVWYYSDKDGKYIGSITKDGWNQVGSDWYYISTYLDENEEPQKYLVNDDHIVVGGNLYAFDYEGKMITDSFYRNYEDGEEYYLGAGGAAIKGWAKVNGRWIYGNPELGGALVYYGVNEIGGKRYYFDERYLVTGKTFYARDYEKVFTADASGVITSEKDPSGWVYSDADLDGQAYYYENGEAYEGWLGNYYFKYGQLLINREVYSETIDGYYYVGKTGEWVSTPGWYKIGENSWKYIKNNGTLAYDEWVSSGGKWYYFDGSYMCQDGIYYIDGKDHEFDENGVWLGEYKETTSAGDNGYKNGWHKINGKWYFSNAGKFVRSQALIIDGKTYGFDYDGVMMSNVFERGNGGGFVYFTSSGALAEYTGWQKINGKWLYFNNDHSIPSGWIKDGDTYYYQLATYEYDEYKGESIDIEMVTGYKVIGREVCYFNDSGAFVKKITTGGWQKIDGDWYYIGADGLVVCDEEKYKIGNTYYGFDYSGRMLANEIIEGDFGFRFYEANGALVETAGWKQVGSKWVYVKADGYVALHGVYNIGGTRYFFSDGYWVK